MTSEQKHLVRESFARLRHASVPVALLFYGRLFEVDPSLRLLFRHDMRTQATKLMDMLAAIVDGLDSFELLRPQLQELGRKHRVDYKVRDEHYDTLRNALVWAFGQALQPEFYPETRAAWIAAIDVISATMRETPS